MKVYLVWYDNGEAYEDHYYDVESVFSSMAGAEKYLDEKYAREAYRMYDGNLHGFVDSTKWVAKKDYVCCEGYNECNSSCPRYNEWVNSDDDYEEETYPCEDYHRMPDSYDDNYWYYIEEREVNE